MKKGYRSADEVRDERGRQYHIGLGPGDVARAILLVGDPARAERAATLLDSEEGRWSHREFLTITGRRGSTRLTLMATGIGCDNTEIAVVELAALVSDATLIRAGTCGALSPSIELGDLIVTWGAVRLESTSTAFVPEGYPAVAHPDVTRALLHAAAAAGYPHHFGMTATAAGFYGAQGRRNSHFPPRRPELIDELARIGVLNLEMETSTLLTLASLRGFRAGTVCTAFANRAHGKFVAPDQQREFEDRAVTTALAALEALTG